MAIIGASIISTAAFTIESAIYDQFKTQARRNITKQ